MRHRDHHLGAAVGVDGPERRGAGRGLGSGPAEPGGQLPHLVVDAGHLDVGVGAEAVHVFLRGLAVVEGQRRGQAGGQDVRLHRSGV